MGVGDGVCVRDGAGVGVSVGGRVAVRVGVFWAVGVGVDEGMDAGAPSEDGKDVSIGLGGLGASRALHPFVKMRIKTQINQIERNPISVRIIYLSS